VRENPVTIMAPLCMNVWLSHSHIELVWVQLAIQKQKHIEGITLGLTDSQDSGFFAWLSVS